MKFGISAITNTLASMLPPVAPVFGQKYLLRERMRGERWHASLKNPLAAKHAARHFFDAIEIKSGG